MAKKAYIGVPETYTQLDYIQSSGTQYIDTGVIGKSGLEANLRIEFPSLGAYAILSARNSDRFYMVQVSDGKWDYGYGNYYYTNVAISTNRIYDVYSKMYAGEQIFKVDGTVIATGSVTTTYNTNISLFLLAYNNAGTAANFASAKLYSCQIYDNGTMIRDFVPCRSSSGDVGLLDRLTNKFYTNDGTGTFTAGNSVGTIDIGGVAHKVKKMYVGVEGMARKVKKAYIGVGGVARPCFGSGELAYYGTITALSQARTRFAATTIGDYALFGGGTNNDYTMYSKVDAYNKSLTISTPTALSTARCDLAATTVGDYALFGGGMSQSAINSSTLYSKVDAYNKSLTRSTPTALSAARSDLAATTVGDYALFGGGMGSGNTGGLTTVDAYNKSLTRSTPTALNGRSYSLAATTVGDYALFGGGKSSYSSYNASVSAYDKSLTRNLPTSFSETRSDLAATTVGDYALFGGGKDASSVYSSVYTYNKSLTRGTAPALSYPRRYLSATTVGDYALFGGGNVSSNYYTNVEAYNASLTRSLPTGLTQGRCRPAATTVGDYALFAGGNSSAIHSTVDAYVC